MGMRFLFLMKMFWNQVVMMVAQFVNILKTTVPNTLEFYRMNYMSIFKSDTNSMEGSFALFLKIKNAYTS